MSGFIETSIDILGKSYQIKCPADEVHSLQHAANQLEEKMQELREKGGILSADRIAVITALNIMHQLITIEHQKESCLAMINQRLQGLQTKIEHALSPALSMELQSA